MTYGILHPNRTYFRGHVAIGPAFGADASDAARFNTRRAALAAFCSHPFAFDGCKVVQLGKVEERPAIRAALETK